MGEGHDAHWSLDKRIPVGIIAVMLIQTITAGVWVGTIQSRLSYVETYIDSRSQDTTKLAVVESQLSNINTTLSELKGDIKDMAGRLK